MDFCSPGTCKARVRVPAVGTGWKLFKNREGKSLCHRGVLGATRQLCTIYGYGKCLSISVNHVLQLPEYSRKFLQNSKFTCNIFTIKNIFTMLKNQP